MRICTECDLSIEQEKDRCKAPEEYGIEDALPRHKHCCVGCHVRYGWPIDTKRWPHLKHYKNTEGYNLI